MNVPERALPFIEGLESFLQSKRMAGFQREALDRFLGEGREPDDEDRQAALDYILFGHRDHEGRKLVDHFLEEKSKDLGDEEREVYSRFREAIFGFFQVEEVRPGEGLRLRRAGTVEVVEVVDAMGSRGLSPKMGLFAHLLPFRGHHELAGGPQSVPPHLAYLIGREIERLGAKGLQGLSDPVAIYQAIKAGRRAPPPAENQLEAELQAAVVFSEIGFPLTVEEVQRRFQGMKSALRLFDEIKSEVFTFKDKNDFDRFMDVLQALWNHTPRDEFEGKSPRERMKELKSLGHRTLPSYLAQDLMGEVVRKLAPEHSSDAASRQQAQRDWFATPQEELEGFSPDELLSNPLPPPPPPEDAALPPLDTPRWPRETVQGFLGSGKPAARFWALEKAINEGDPFPLGSLLSFLDETAGGFTSAALLMIRGLGGEDLGADLPALRKAIEDRLQKFRKRDRYLHEEALETLKWVREEEALRACGTGAERIERLLRQVCPGGDGDWDVWDASRALEKLVRTRDGEAIARGTASFLERLILERDDEEHEDDEDDDDRDFSPERLLLGDLEGIELRKVFLEQLEWRLFPDYPESDEERSERCRQVLRLLEPSADPQAAGRSSEVLGEPRKDGLFRLIGDADVLPLCSLLQAMAREALGLARAQNPPFAGLARALEGLLDGFGDQEKQGSLPPGAQRALAAALFGVLFKAIQGRHLEAELAERRGDPEKLLEILRVNDPWIEFGEKDLEAFAILPPSEDLLKIAQSPDFYVRRSALLILAAIDPGKDLDRFLDSSLDDGSMHYQPRSLSRCAGDAILLPLARRFHREPSGSNADHLLDGILAVRTLRAGAFLDRYLESLVGREPSELTDAIIECGNRALAEGFLDRLSRGCLELAEERDGEFDFDDLVERVEVLIALHSLSGDAGEIVGEGVAMYETRLNLLEDPKEREEEDEEEEEQQEERTSYLRTIEPIRREKPKVGRNDPCPCGSGKKYKKCCGKGG
jgi:hypothetical protein